LNHHPTLFSNWVCVCVCVGGGVGGGGERIAACPRWNSGWPGLTCCSIGTVSAYTKCSLSCWPKCERILHFSLFQNEKLLNSAMWTHWGLNSFFLPNPIFAICLNFQQQKNHSKIIMFHPLALKIVKQNPTCQRLTNNIKNSPKFQYSF
jgi:hypothetical protein